MIYSILYQVEHTVVYAELKQMALDGQEKTPEQHVATGASNGEEVLFVNCPSCKAVLAAYIRTGKVPVALGPIEPVHQVPLSIDGKLDSSG